MKTVRCAHCGKRFRATYDRCSKCMNAAPGNVAAEQEDMRLSQKLIRMIIEEEEKK